MPSNLNTDNPVFYVSAGTETIQAVENSNSWHASSRMVQYAVAPDVAENPNPPIRYPVSHRLYAHMCTIFDNYYVDEHFFPKHKIHINLRGGRVW